MNINLPMYIYIYTFLGYDIYVYNKIYNNAFCTPNKTRVSVFLENNDFKASCFFKKTVYH